MKTVYDWILTCGGQVDFWYGVHCGWFQNDNAEEYANRAGNNALGPNEDKLNGVVLTFEMLEALNRIELPPDFQTVPAAPGQFWRDLHSGKYYNTEPEGEKL